MTVRESGKYDLKIDVTGWKLLPSGCQTRNYVENYLMEMAEVMGCRKGNLKVSGNTYPNAVLSGWSIDDEDVHNRITGTMTFDISEQTRNNQFTVQNIYAYTKGTNEAFFIAKDYITGIEKTFEFRQHIYCIPKLLPKAVKKDNEDDANKVYSGRAGLEIDAAGWCVYGDPGGSYPLNESRKNLEAYVYNCLTGPLGLVGTFRATGNDYTNSFFSNVSMSDDGPNPYFNWKLNFLVSPQC